MSRRCVEASTVQALAKRCASTATSGLKGEDEWSLLLEAGWAGNIIRAVTALLVDHGHRLQLPGFISLVPGPRRPYFSPTVCPESRLDSCTTLLLFTTGG